MVNKNKVTISKVPQIDAPSFAMNPAEFSKLLGLEDLTVKRIYWINKVKGEKVSGQHAHKDTEDEIFVIMAGTVTVVLDEDGTGKKETELETNSILWVPRMVWHGFKNLSDDCVILALTTTNYDPDRSGYIEDYGKFQELAKEK